MTLRDPPRPPRHRDDHKCGRFSQHRTGFAERSQSWNRFLTPPPQITADHRLHRRPETAQPLGQFVVADRQRRQQFDHLTARPNDAGRPSRSPTTSPGSSRGRSARNESPRSARWPCAPASTPPRPSSCRPAQETRVRVQRMRDAVPLDVVQQDPLEQRIVVPVVQRAHPGEKVQVAAPQPVINSRRPVQPDTFFDYVRH